MSKLIIAGLFCLALCACVTQVGRHEPVGPGVSSAQSVVWYSLTEGGDKARRENKPMVVEFFIEKGCPRCERMNTTVYSDPAIISELNNFFIPIRISLAGNLTDNEKALGERYAFKNDCLLLFLAPDGSIIEHTGGKRLCFADYVGPDWYLEYLKYIKGLTKGR